MTSWLRRNTLALAVIGIIVPLYYFIGFVPRFNEYAKTRSPDPDITVQYGHSTELRGTTWSVQKVLREKESRSAFSPGPLPDGYETFRILFGREPAGAPTIGTHCEATLVAGEIRWGYRIMGYGVGGTNVNISKGPADTTTRCDEPETFQLGFLVPKGTNPDAVEIAFSFKDATEQKPTVVRFVLPR
ncbi:hypothetical protein FZI91_04790 [Mycobacterium sp. CBMA271]|uniref:hypothetical protein n=1 Tax=unclassified Mycobacteroides TaxID=2618759 RepID=UPI0012DE23EA|nr:MULTISPECIES: hypothetical protein [unclassified Mycobacteroides]MUM19826.1 hypothetical protein [Mycobacteroides sp. CBMA 326]MUM21017.1 hypothetical protein [Mycobacteroides sp. CBMA 271]